MEHTLYYHKLSGYLMHNQALWQATIVQTTGSSPARAGMKMLIPLIDDVFGNLGGGEMEHSIISYIQEKRPEVSETITFDLSGKQVGDANTTNMICGGSVTVFIEPLHLPRLMYIIGAGHCGKALGQLAKQCGWFVHLVDNRSEIIESDLSNFGHRASLSDYSDIDNVIDFGPNTWVVIMTHGHLHDKEVLQQCLNQTTRYLGMIGSQNKVKETFDVLRSQGFLDSRLEKVHAPIGLKIGSQSPIEIAISIMAELIRDFRLGE